MTKHLRYCIALIPLLLSVLACGKGGQLYFGADHQKLFCQTDHDCKSLEICTPDLGCQPRMPSCDSNEACQDGQSCSNGRCLEPGVCYFNYQCPSEQICENYRCVFNRCSQDEQCPQNQRCDVIVGSCREDLCSTDDDCPNSTCCDSIAARCVPSNICEWYENGIPPDCAPSDELCDQLDNDCDAAIDEDFANLGNSCSSGTGICLRLGHFTCTADGTNTQCDAVPGPSDPEVCDGVDNDCDGAIDEGC